MPDCNGTNLSEQARLLGGFIQVWRAMGVQAYAGICGCEEAQKRNFIILSPGKTEICGICGKPVKMVQIADYKVEQKDDKWLVKESNGHHRSTE